MRLEVNDLTYGYPSRTIGEHVNFTVAPGEILCVLGPNGGGKTTLFRTLLGLLAVRDGSVVLNDKPLSEWNRRELARTIGYVPQAHVGYFAFTVGEVVLMGRTAHIGLFATPNDHDRDVAAAAIATLGIAHLADHVYTEISGGERQLTLIARALAQQPKMLVLDEPTANLDFGNQIKVLRKVAELAKSGLSVLFTTHDPDQALHWADRVLLLRDGKILATGKPDEVITSDNLRALYGVNVDVLLLPDRHGIRTCIPASN